MSYDFIREKGKGGFAKVDVVCDSVTCKQFARKTYQPSDAILKNVTESELKKRFVREVKYQKQLKHPNIVEIIEASLDDDPPSFIMPLAACTLNDEIYSNAVNTEQLKGMLFDILAGLEYMHNRGYIHRDLKPANILKFQQDNDVIYALSDFGLISIPNSDSSQLTSSNAGGGTENYSAPELIKGLRTATPKADIYSFGAILHDIFGKNVKRIPYDELSLPNHPIDKVIQKCTKRIPQRRYQNISELREELYDVLNNENIEFTSFQEESVVYKLKNNDVLNDEEWDTVFIQLDENINNNRSVANIIDALNLQHIQSLSDTAPVLLNALGKYFAEYITENDFSFDYCDILANKAERFYDYGEMELKALISIALLKLGTSHNRFYVEKKAKKYLSNDIPAKLANRIKVELEVQEIDFKEQIEHLCESIDVDDDFVHETLRDLL